MPAAVLPRRPDPLQELKSVLNRQPLVLASLSPSRATGGARDRTKALLDPSILITSAKRVDKLLSGMVDAAATARSKIEQIALGAIELHEVDLPPQASSSEASRSD